MNKLILLLFIPFICFSQEDIERYKVYNTTNIYTSLLLDTATGKIWQLQIGVGDTDKLKTVLSEREYAKTIETITEEWNKEIEEKMKYWEEEYNSKPDSIVSAKIKAYSKPYTLKEYIDASIIAKNGRFKLYPTDNMYNFIMVDVVNGNTYQVQWSTKSKERFISRFW
jgi:hypothetical protein